MTAREAELDVVAIRERAEEATPGPWSMTDDAFTPPRGSVDVHRIGSAKLNADVAAVVKDHGRSALDAEFIAHARADVPTLLDEVERLRVSLDEECMNRSDTEHERDAARADRDRIVAGVRALVEGGVGVDLNPTRPSLGRLADSWWLDYLGRLDRSWRGRLRALLHDDEGRTPEEQLLHDIFAAHDDEGPEHGDPFTPADLGQLDKGDAS